MSRLLVSVAFVAFVLGGNAAAAAAEEPHQDTRLGFKIKPPADFTKVPLKPDEEWIAARWISEKAYYQTDKTDGWTQDHKPEMYVIAFPKKTATTEDEKPLDLPVPIDPSKPIVIKISEIKIPFKDYRDYLKRTYNEGGFYVAAEDKADVEGVQVETLEIKVERMVMGGPRKIVTWIYKGTDVDIAVQFEMWETAWSKLKPDVLSSLRSFRRIAKDAAATPPDSGSGLKNALNEKNLDSLNPAQRAARRREQEQQNEVKLAKDLPEGWAAKHYGRVFAISHLDDKATRKFCDDASAVLDFLDANLGYIGPGEYVRAPVVRICKDSDEYSMYQKGTAWSWGDEIVCYRNTGYISSYSFGGNVTERCATHWLRERNDDLYFALPWWVEIGLDSAFGKSKINKGKLEFYNDSWERVDVAQQIRDGKLSSLKQLMHLSNTELQADMNRRAECAAAVRFFLTGPKKAKEAFRAYLDALGPIVKQRAEERKKALASAAPAAKPKTEEEEDAAFKAAREKSRDESKGLLEDTYRRAFGTMSESDWKAIELAYQKSLG